MISPLYGAIRSGEWADTADTLSKQNKNNIKNSFSYVELTELSHPTRK